MNHKKTGIGVSSQIIEETKLSTRNNSTLLNFSLVVILSLCNLLLPISTPSTSAISFGCKKAQSDASWYLESAFYYQNSEADNYRKRLYSDAFRHFQKAVENYARWRKVVTRSPKCFAKDNYVARVRIALKGYENNQTMASRYGIEIAKKNNYGSADPCFNYLGSDEDYLQCRINIGEKEGRIPEYGP